MSKHAASRRRTHAAIAAGFNVPLVAAVAAVVVTGALAALVWTHRQTRLVQHNVVQTSSMALSCMAGGQADAGVRPHQRHGADIGVPQ